MESLARNAIRHAARDVMTCAMRRRGVARAKPVGKVLYVTEVCDTENERQTQYLYQ